MVSYIILEFLITLCDESHPSVRSQCFFGGGGESPMERKNTFGNWVSKFSLYVSHNSSLGHSDS